MFLLCELPLLMLPNCSWNILTCFPLPVVGVSVGLMSVESILCHTVKGNNYSYTKPLLYDATICPTKEFVNLESIALWLKLTKKGGVGLNPAVAYAFI